MVHLSFRKWFNQYRQCSLCHTLNEEEERVFSMVTKNMTKFRPYNQGYREDWGGPRAKTKRGPRAKTKRGAWQYRLCEGRLGACPQEILHSLKCVLGLLRLFFCACTQYIYTCKLPPSISSFRSKSTTYRASQQAATLYNCALVCVNSVKTMKQKSRLTSVENKQNEPS